MHKTKRICIMLNDLISVDTIHEINSIGIVSKKRKKIFVTLCNAWSGPHTGMFAVSKRQNLRCTIDLP